MGGLGSGERAEKKTQVEVCLVLKVARYWKRVTEFERFLISDIRWRNSLGQLILSVHYRLENFGESPVLHLLSCADANGRERPRWERITLTSTKPNFGGLRWWFMCPLSNKGVACERRVAKLYLPPRGLYFGCRTCHDLTYESAQTHDNRINRLMKNPLALVEAFNSLDPAESLRACQAYGKVLGLMK